MLVTDNNPNLGLTDIVGHLVTLKANPISNHHKRVLREHLDKLLKQHIIVPVSESENLPITNAVILVMK